ncbi:MAG: hypothetical protein ABW250_06110 [Pyrinomonadaceae bacterium]
MRRILVPILLCLLAADLQAQSGRRDLAYYDPEKEVDAIFRRESEFLEKMSSYVNLLRVVYETPGDGRAYERLMEVGRHDSGNPYERRMLARGSSLKRFRRPVLVPAEHIFRGHSRDDYSVTRLREEGGLRVFAVNPVEVFKSARRFRGLIWVDGESRIVKSQGEWLPRWLGDEFALACTMTREKGLPKSLMCDDSVTINGEFIRVVAHFEHYDFRRFGADSRVIEEGVPGEVEP